MLKLKDIKIGDSIKINNITALGSKGMLIANSPLKECYEVISIEENVVNDEVGAVGIKVSELEDGRTIVGVIFETDLEHVELVNN